MCVGLPARILTLTPGVLPMGRVLLNGAEMDCCLAYVPEAEIGDHVLVQNGFAMQLLDAQSAADSLAAFAELGVLPPQG